MATFLDKLLFILLIVFTIASFIFVKELLPAGTLVKISVNHRTVYSLPLYEDRVIMVTGSLGDNVIEIKNGKVRMNDAPCPRKLCIHQGAIERGSIVCLPNKMIVSISGNKQLSTGSGLDAVSR